LLYWIIWWYIVIILTSSCWRCHVCIWIILFLTWNRRIFWKLIIILHCWIEKMTFLIGICKLTNTIIIQIELRFWLFPFIIHVLRYWFFDVRIIGYLSALISLRSQLLMLDWIHLTSEIWSNFVSTTISTNLAFI
jgi:hypothetical protein